MQMLLITLVLGGSGATMPPPAAEIAHHVIDAFVAKDYERAAELQLQFALFPSKWMHRGLAPVMKAAMNLIGVAVGEPYPPTPRSRTTKQVASPRSSRRPCWPSGNASRQPNRPPIRLAAHETGSR
jgi:dihydrodipicolinate synthase/N-acetylneuraminate lyase